MESGCIEGIDYNSMLKNKKWKGWLMKQTNSSVLQIVSNGFYLQKSVFIHVQSYFITDRWWGMVCQNDSFDIKQFTCNLQHSQNNIKWTITD